MNSIIINNDDVITEFYGEKFIGTNNPMGYYLFLPNPNIRIVDVKRKNRLWEFVNFLGWRYIWINE